MRFGGSSMQITSPGKAPSRIGDFRRGQVWRASFIAAHSRWNNGCVTPATYPNMERRAFSVEAMHSMRTSARLRVVAHYIRNLTVKFFPRKGASSCSPSYSGLTWRIITTR
jgi:hypothetical protein